MIYKNEIETLALLKKLAETEDIPVDELYKSFVLVSREYQNLHRQMRNLIKVSDSSQNKLLKFQEKLIEQNQQIQYQNEQLNYLNQEKDRLLLILNGELKNAFEYLKSLMPKPIKNQDISTDWVLIPSAEIGGDALGYYWIDNSNFVFYILDVCGHGIGAALHSVQILNTLQYKTLSNIDYKQPDEVLTALNSIFQMKDHNEIYFSLFYGVFNKADSVLTYGSGGHPPAMLINSDNNLQHINSQNSLIGVRKYSNFRSSQIYIEKPSTIYLFTDGTYEIRNEYKGLLKLDNFREMLFNQVHKKNQSLQDLYSDSIDYSGKISIDDDYTILKINFV